MKKKIMAIGTIILLLMTGLICVPSVVSIEREQGTFEAELGRRGNERPIVTLNGSYHTRNRFFIIRGTAIAGDHLRRFKGIFSSNYFIIRIPIRGSMFTIVGKCRFDSEQQTFVGIWIGRGIPVRGWIKGTYTPEN